MSARKMTGFLILLGLYSVLISFPVAYVSSMSPIINDIVPKFASAFVNSTTVFDWIPYIPVVIILHRARVSPIHATLIVAAALAILTLSFCVGALLFLGAQPLLLPLGLYPYVSAIPLYILWWYLGLYRQASTRLTKNEM